MSKKNYLALFAKSFNWAGFFLPKNTYNDCSKLYAFCRVLDDLVDKKDSLELRIERFSEIKNIFKKNYQQNTKHEKEFDQKEHELIVNDMIILANNNNIKRIILDDLIEGVESDLKEKIQFYSNNFEHRSKIAEKGKNRYFELFDHKLVTKFMINKIFHTKITDKKSWMN